MSSIEDVPNSIHVYVYYRRVDNISKVPRPGNNFYICKVYFNVLWVHSLNIIVNFYLTEQSFT